MDSTSACVKPANEPAPAIRSPKAKMSRSVVANEFPKSTIVEPSRVIFSPILSGSTAKILDNRARPLAASSVDRLVDTPNAATVSVNSRSSLLAIPNCPPNSPISANSSKASGTVLDKSTNPFLNASPSSFNTPIEEVSPSVVLTTPAKADSKLIAV